MYLNNKDVITMINIQKGNNEQNKNNLISDVEILIKSINSQLIYIKGLFKKGIRVSIQDTDQILETFEKLDFKLNKIKSDNLDIDKQICILINERNKLNEELQIINKKILSCEPLL